ncbi:hypothetical protein Pst134EB_012518 [Puccinia striiformis f. sp. tritici]|nr:hypothetical protein Pst134EB_012518 [Puccinia striiformis f. sp. tritici]
MAETFSTPAYSVQNYASYRPSYPPELYQAIMDYHQASGELAIDLGCGTGIVSAELVRRGYFNRVVGVDPSKPMLDHAKKTITNAEFVHGRAESLPWITNGSVDLLVAGTAAHWFDPTWWKEAGRILKPQGTLAVFVYGGLWPDPGHPCAQELRATMFSFAEELGFSSEGNRICHHMYDELPLPDMSDKGNLGDFERIDWNRNGLGDQLVMADRIKLHAWRERARTYGPAHRWQIDNPTKVGDKLLDPVEKTLTALKSILETEDDELEIVCGHSLSLLLFRQRVNCAK